MKKILAVVLNWRRPHNVRLVIDNLREQSVPVHITLVDCAPNSEHAATDRTLEKCDDVFTIQRNLGPCSRFVAPLMLPQFRYTYFAVDDHLPGPRHIECLLRCAESLNNRFATIGQDGRHIRDGQIIKRRAKLDPAGPSPIDVITSSELMESRWISSVVDFRRRMVANWGDEAESFLFEDDLILCMAARKASGDPSYITATCEPDEWWSVRKLPSPHALCARPDHAERRDQFIAKMKGI